MTRTALALALCLLAAACTAPQDRPGAPAATLTLASWNMEHLAERNGTGCRPRTDADYAAMRTYAEALQADVIAFQEVESRAAAQRVFDPARWDADHPVRVVLIGTDFEVKVWETLLKIPVGKATTYQRVANHIGKPTAARAVGAAVGKNPISFVVPCHRVVGTSGALTGYHWGLPRKRAILGWESGVVGA